MRSVDILIGLDINEHHGVISSSLSRTGLQLRRDRRQDRLVLGGLCPPEKDQRRVNWARPGRLPNKTLQATHQEAARWSCLVVGWDNLKPQPSSSHRPILALVPKRTFVNFIFTLELTSW